MTVTEKRPMKLAAYPQYKPSGVEWLGEIPGHWKVIRVKTLEGNTSRVVQTGPFGAQLHASDYVDEGIPLILIRNVGEMRLDESNMPRVELEDAERLSMYRVEPGDIVFSRVGSIGRIAPITERERGWLISGQMLRLRVRNPALDSRFAAYAFGSSSVLTFVELQSVGSTRESINTDILRNLPLPLPPVDDQHAIAVFLDRETQRIDSLVAKKERQIELLQEKRAALISHAVTKGLDPNVPMNDSGIQWLGAIPNHWDVYRAKVLFREVNDRSTTGDEELLTVSHITGVTPRAEKDVNMFLAESLEDYKRCDPGDLVINTMWAWMGAMGFASRAGIVSPSYNVYRFRNNAPEPRFYDYLFRTGRFAAEVRCHSQGIWTSRLRLYPEEFFEIRLPCPPPGEQRSIVAAIQNETGSYDVLQARIERSIEKLREYRVALISAAVTGKIDVREEAA
ncbi:MAG: restriction endonuclease subunit S [Elusimicrobia bacterium]|nr:restriction endonuclease subunit S [Elusimicrobiota bacterium]